MRVQHQQSGLFSTGAWVPHKYSQSLDHLEALKDTVKAKVFLPSEKPTMIRELTLQRQKKMDLMFLVQLLGLMIAAIGLVPWARFHVRMLQWVLLPFQTNIRRKRSHKLVTLTTKLKKSLRWWMVPENLVQRIPLFQNLEFTENTSVTLRGWRAHFLDKVG